MFRSTNPIRGSPSPSFRNESFLFFSQLAGDSSKKLVVDNDKIVIELSLERTNFSEKLRGTHGTKGEGEGIGSIGVVGPRTSCYTCTRCTRVQWRCPPSRRTERERERGTAGPRLRVCRVRAYVRVTKPVVVVVSPLADQPVSLA